MITHFKSGFPTTEKSFLYRNWAAGPNAYHLLPNYKKKKPPQQKNPDQNKTQNQTHTSQKHLEEPGRLWKMSLFPKLETLSEWIK